MFRAKETRIREDVLDHRIDTRDEPVLGIQGDTVFEWACSIHEIYPLKLLI